jgi:hypothetical protein
MLMVSTMKKKPCLENLPKEMVVQLREWSVPCQDGDFLIGPSDSDDVIDVGSWLVYGQTLEK